MCSISLRVFRFSFWLSSLILFINVSRCVRMEEKSREKREKWCEQRRTFSIAMILETRDENRYANMNKILLLPCLSGLSEMFEWFIGVFEFLRSIRSEAQTLVRTPSLSRLHSTVRRRMRILITALSSAWKFEAINTTCRHSRKHTT